MVPDEPIRTAVIGAGLRGPNLIRNFDNPPASVVKTIVDRDGARLEQLQRRFSGVAVALDAALVMGDPTIDAVVIATPTSSRHALVNRRYRRSGAGNVAVAARGPTSP